jgi:hypothetical protein
MENPKTFDRESHIEPRGKAIIPTKAAAKWSVQSRHSTEATVANQEKRDPHQDDDFFSKGPILQKKNLLNYVSQPAAKNLSLSFTLIERFLPPLKATLAALVPFSTESD